MIISHYVWNRRTAHFSPYWKHSFRTFRLYSLFIGNIEQVFCFPVFFATFGADFSNVNVTRYIFLRVLCFYICFSVSGATNLKLLLLLLLIICSITARLQTRFKTCCSWLYCGLHLFLVFWTISGFKQTENMI